MYMASEEIKYRILFIDDEEANLRVFRSTFRWDYEVITAISASVAKDILYAEPIDLIITDQRMPDVTGVEFLEMILPDFPDIPRIIMTGYSDVDSIIEAINRGKIFQYITKPWKKEEIQFIIEKALEESILKKNNKQLITHLQESNGQLSNALGELDNFIYKASHDLMSPITSILGLVNLVKMPAPEDDRLLYVDKIDETAKKMKYFLSHLALVNIVNDKEIEPQKSNFDKLFNQYKSYSNEGFQIKVNVEQNTDCITDEGLLNIAISQIIENALRYTHPHKQGEAEISVAHTSGGIVITITDNGIGIEEEYADQYFNVFFKGDGSEGNGIGLFIAKKVVEKLQGKIWISGQANKGASVKIRLPSRMDQDILGIAKTAII